MGNWTAAIAEERIWIPVAPRYGESIRPDDGPGRLADALDGHEAPNFILRSPLSASAFDKSESRLFHQRRKFMLRVDLSSMEGDRNRDVAVLDAERTAAEMAFVDGVLHTARHQMGVARSYGGRWDATLVDTRPGVESFLRYSYPNLNQVQLEGFDATRKANALGFSTDGLDALTKGAGFGLGTEGRRPDWHVAAATLLRERLLAIVPGSRQQCVVGRGHLAHVDLPADLDEIAFDGRRLLRRCAAIAGTDGWQALPEDDLLRWFAESEECVLRSTRDARGPNQLRDCFTDVTRECMTIWLEEVEKPRRARASISHPPEEDLDAISDMRF